jgi:hypothetical protein
MSRLRGNLPAYLQQRFGICRRTFERWCARGDVPGAYRTRGGHWRVRNPTWAAVRSLLSRPRDKTRRDEVRRAIVDYPFPPIPWGPLDTVLASKFWLAANRISEEDFLDLDLKQRDPEKYHFLWEKPVVPRPRWFFEAINDPQYAPAITAVMIRVNGRTVTSSALARELGVSVNTLYRRYGQREIRRVCQEPPLCVLASVGKKTPVRARSELD